MKGSYIAIALIVLILIGGGVYYFTTLSGGYFDIKELGIRFKPSVEISDLKYEMYGEGANAWAAFTSKSLEAKDPNCMAGALGGVFVSDKMPQAGVQQYGSVTRVGSTYVFYVKPKTPCSGDPAAVDLTDLQVEFLQTSLDKSVDTI